MYRFVVAIFTVSTMVSVIYVADADSQFPFCRFGGYVHTLLALLCYTCSYSWASVDDACIVKPTHQTNCTKKYCTIVRQELVREHGKVATFLRGCEDKLQEYNSVVTDSTYKTYYRSCISDLCNDSDGRRPISSADPNIGAMDNMIIKGKPRK
ncbi:uncharacterized protein LOC133337038 [Musca vetustissima]|uniref:uncharacterized protein LOC133337038 n=1 Tax=Musca vetustissima TaxID=27455 RepID=UPI002AB75321|nr:uncharacterized protein LOC133337038 [Musca vetustissima]